MPANPQIPGWLRRRGSCPCAGRRLLPGLCASGCTGSSRTSPDPYNRDRGYQYWGLLGAAYVDGISLRDLCDLGRRVRLRDFLRFHRSEHSAQMQRKDCIGQFIQEWFHAHRLEQLPIPTAIVTTDLDTGAPYVFTKGSVELAIHATCAFPGLLKPVEFEGHRLADGCIVAPVPTEIAARIYGGCVVGVRVDSNAATANFSENAVKVFDPAFHASHTKSLEPSWVRHADVLLEPQVHQIGWNDFSRVDEAFAAGAEAMRRALPSLRELLARRSDSVSSPDVSFLGERELTL